MRRAFRVLVGFAGCLPAVAVAAQLLVLNKTDSTLAFIDPESGQIHASIPTGEGPHEIELSSDGKLAFVSNYGGRTAGNTLSVIAVGARKELQRVDLGELRRPHGLSFADEHLYITAEAARRIARFDPRAKRIDWTFATDQDVTHMVLAAPDGKRLFATNMGSNTVSIIERGADDQWRQMLIAVGEGPEGLDLSPDGRELWTAHSRDGGISITDVGAKRVIHTFDAKTKRSNRLKFTRDGKLVLVSDLGAGDLVVFDARTRTERARLPLGRYPTGILIAPDGRYAYVAVSGDDRIAVIDLRKLAIVKTIATGSSPDGMALVE